MREAQTNTGDIIRVSIGRFGSSPLEIQVPKDCTVQRALEIAGLSGETGNLFVQGAPARLENLLDDGDIVNIVTSKQGGRA